MAAFGGIELLQSPHKRQSIYCLVGVNHNATTYEPQTAFCCQDICLNLRVNEIAGTNVSMNAGMRPVRVV